MKIAFSTLGCPGWTFEEIVSAASDLGADGIEIRGIGNELYAPRIGNFLPGHIEKTKNKLNAIRLEIPMLTSAACIGDRQPGDAICEARAYIDLASELKAPYIRVLASRNPEPDVEVDIAKTAQNYDELCGYGEAKGVTPLIETNGELADSAKMAEFMGHVKSGNCGVLWDIHHPYRFFHEKPDETYHKLKKYIRYLHVKDSVMNGDIVEYRMMGRGDVPVRETLEILKAGGFEGYISLEWVKRWNPDLEEPGIVFSHYINYMKSLLSKIG